MKFIKNLVLWLVLLLVFIVVILAAADNSEDVVLTFLDYSTPAWPISWWVLIAFVSGVVVTSLLNFWLNTSLRLAARKARNQVQKVNKNLDKVMAEQVPVETEHNS